MVLPTRRRCEPAEPTLAAALARPASEAASAFTIAVRPAESAEVGLAFRAPVALARPASAAVIAALATVAVAAFAPTLAPTLEPAFASPACAAASAAPSAWRARVSVTRVAAVASLLEIVLLLPCHWVET
jgi:hypothetical protein